jgi:hypothetical protein
MIARFGSLMKRSRRQRLPPRRRPSLSKSLNFCQSTISTVRFRSTKAEGETYFETVAIIDHAVSSLIGFQRRLGAC